MQKLLLLSIHYALIERLATDSDLADAVATGRDALPGDPAPHVTLVGTQQLWPRVAPWSHKERFFRTIVPPTVCCRIVPLKQTESNNLKTKP